ncbi:MAG: orotidine-5-phosphate decarboxylase, partial [Verrucomicrobiota bacterium]
MRYIERLRQRIGETGSRLCVGLDPRPGEGGAAIAREMLLRVIEQTAPYAAAFKPNMAYFEAMGLEGIRLLEELLKGMPSEVPVILDAKRSDIGETQKYY